MHDREGLHLKSKNIDNRKSYQPQSSMKHIIVLQNNHMKYAQHKIGNKLKQFDKKNNTNFWL
uniref:Uncharacterized protein n=1 Tax=Lotus japonicus TaxID=34305 RepID=I3T5M4_LOTJA|nr:unknown [Lotus japonicus]